MKTNKKYHYKTKANGICLETCNIKSYKIGSMSCGECQHNTWYDHQNKTIICTRIEEATKHLKQ